MFFDSLIIRDKTSLSYKLASIVVPCGSANLEYHSFYLFTYNVDFFLSGLADDYQEELTTLATLCNLVQ